MSLPVPHIVVGIPISSRALPAEAPGRTVAAGPAALGHQLSGLIGLESFNSSRGPITGY